MIDKIETLAKLRALKLFGLDPEVWDVNLQCLSGCVANIVAYSAVMDIGDKALGMKLSEGGHLSHGFFLGEKKISHTSKYYDWDHYGVDDEGFLDYADLEQVGALGSYVFRFLFCFCLFWFFFFLKKA